MSDEAPPLIEYPTHYVFKAVGPAGINARVRELVESVLGPLGDGAFVERPSSQGKYVSVSAHVHLQSEDQRRRVYEAFHQEKQIVFYL